MRIDDPWYDALASGWGEERGGSAATAVRTPADGGPPSGAPGTDPRAAALLAVHRSAAFQEARRRHRRFVLPIGAAFLAWYLAYIATAATAPHLLARPVGSGPLTVGALAALAQFAAALLLAWAYTRHARLHRDRSAFELRWQVQDTAREATGRAREGAAR